MLSFHRVGPLALTSTLLLVSCISVVAHGAEPAVANQTAERYRGDAATLEYLKYLPAGYDDSDDTFPLLLFLHGGGESGRDLLRVAKHGPPRMIAEGHAFEMVVVSPQNPGVDSFWDDVALAGLVDEICRTHRIDESRIYLTGLSRGGFGAWRLAIQNPNRFAALVPIAGGGLASYAFRIKDLPIWAFHGQLDPVIAPEESRRMVNAVNAAGGGAKLTIYPDAKHDCWTRAYADDAMWQWLLSQRR